MKLDVDIKLPFDMKPTMAAFDGQYYYLICEDEHTYYQYKWDGFSSGYQSVRLFIKVAVNPEP